MKEKRLRLILVILTVVLILMSLAAESVYFSDFEYRSRTRRFNKVLKEKEKMMEDCLNGMKPILSRGEIHGSVSENNLFSIAEQQKITILEYISNKLIYWSNNDFDVPRVLNDSLYSKQLIFVQNGWFLTKTVQAGNEQIIGLLRLRTDYGFENDIIKNGFEKDFRLPENTGFSLEKNASEFHILNRNGNFLFTLIFPEVKSNTFYIFIPLLLWALSFILILFITLELVKILVSQNRNLAAVLSCFLVFSVIYAAILVSGKPAVLFRNEVFSPYRYTMNMVIPSLGHLSILSVLISVFSYVFFRYLPISERSGKMAGRDYLYLTFLLIPGALLFLLYHLIFSHLIFNSNINFETYKVLSLNIFSLIGFVTLALLFLVPFFYILKVFEIIKQTRTKTVLFSIITSMIVFVPFFFREPETLIPLALFYVLVTAGIWILRKRKAGIFNIMVVFSLILGLYSVLFITVLSEKKTTENIKIQSVTYSEENDPEAEHLLLNMWPGISTDSLLKEMMGVEYFEKNDVDSISDYLRKTYFNGYWGNFSFNIVLCWKGELLRVGERNQSSADCFSFFEERIIKDGHQLTGTDFYFIDNQQGRSNYLGKLFYENNNKIVNGLFIDLYRDINVFQPGYSELLLDKKYHGYARLKDYSFAKYINGEIVVRTGEFPYDKTDDQYVDKSTDYTLFKTAGFSHVLYRNGNVTVIISRPALSAGDIIISFSYLFAFIFIFSNLVLLLIRKPALKSTYSFNFRQKLQLSFIGILLFSFALVGIVIASLAIKQFQTKHNENIKEKLNSVYIELDSKISMEKYLTSNWRDSTYNSLDEFLIKLSNIFNTDINLFDLNGYLIATSRPEIFYRNLTSRRMNNMASYNLINLSRSEYFQKEKIGNLEYISAYIPFYNTNNELLTYLNLPYFRMQSVLAKEVSNMIVAVINFTLLLIVITMSLAVFISGRLTSPLTMLSSGLASVKLGKKSEHLSYNGSDEVGELVRQYNRMVGELDESAHKLANSEREYAWREMAKQIAHEIKNPLTPMKLNVQQLLKSWKDSVPGFEKKLVRFTKNQIEYIDNLSSIASAFSSFAKMPGANPVEVDLLEQIKTTLELFKNSDNITFRVGWPHESRINIYADKEHLNGIFSNLIKNGIQSIPPGKEGLIKVNLEVSDNRVVVSISDNGKGIPEASQGKMFTPNFTTKSSGMGLGLSIVKRYVENANGKIWFESETDKGSVFHIEFPLMYTGEKSGNF